MQYLQLINIHNIERALVKLTFMGAGLLTQADGDVSKDDVLSDKDRKTYEQMLREILKYAKILKLNELKFLITERFLPKITKNAIIKYGDVLQVSERMRDSLAAVLDSYGCLILSDEDDKLYNGAKKEWTEIITKWGVLEYDATEAAKCIALGRSTAAVFHLMRILEKGGQLLLISLGVTDSPKEKIENMRMERILEILEEQIDSLMYPQNAKKDKQKAQNISNARIHLLDAKEAWRNPTMHPKSVWTLEEAKNIYNNTKEFMITLAKTV